MNKHIDDLLYHSGLTAQGCWDELGTYEQEAIEKFAELIVRKCADIGERYADGNYEVRNQIMAQFGLEEPEE